MNVAKAPVPALLANTEWTPFVPNVATADIPANTLVLVQDSPKLDTRWAMYDPSWAKGKGAWFNTKNHVIQVSRWRPNGQAYIDHHSLVEQPNGSYLSNRVTAKQ